MFAVTDYGQSMPGHSSRSAAAPTRVGVGEGVSYVAARHRAYHLAAVIEACSVGGDSSDVAAPPEPHTCRITVMGGERVPRPRAGAPGDPRRAAGVKSAPAPVSSNEHPPVGSDMCPAPSTPIC